MKSNLSFDEMYDPFLMMIILFRSVVYIFLLFPENLILRSFVCRGFPFRISIDILIYIQDIQCKFYRSQYGTGNATARSTTDKTHHVK